MNSRLKNWLQGGAWYLLLELALVAALAAGLAYWTWVFVTPRPVAAPASGLQSELGNGGLLVKPHLFGSASSRVAATDTPSTSKLRLVGVASSGVAEGGRAIFALEGGKSKTARPGEAVLPGLTLREIHPDHAVLERDGVTERLRLERRALRLDPQPGNR
jgi:general secretion pathway protein C